MMHGERYVSRCCHRQAGRPLRASRSGRIRIWPCGLEREPERRAEGRGGRDRSRRAVPKNCCGSGPGRLPLTTTACGLWLEGSRGRSATNNNNTGLVEPWLLVACSLCCKTFCYRYEIRHTSTLCTLHRPWPHQAALASSPTPSCACTCSAPPYIAYTL